MPLTFLYFVSCVATVECDSPWGNDDSALDLLGEALSLGGGRI